MPPANRKSKAARGRKKDGMNQNVFLAERVESVAETATDNANTGKAEDTEERAKDATSETWMFKTSDTSVKARDITPSFLIAATQAVELTSRTVTARNLPQFIAYEDTSRHSSAPESGDSRFSDRSEDYSKLSTRSYDSSRAYVSERPSRQRSEHNARRTLASSHLEMEDRNDSMLQPDGSPVRQRHPRHGKERATDFHQTNINQERSGQQIRFTRDRPPYKEPKSKRPSLIPVTVEINCERKVFVRRGIYENGRRPVNGQSGLGSDVWGTVRRSRFVTKILRHVSNHF